MGVFESSEHKNKYLEYMSKLSDNMQISKEYQSLFYLLSSNEDIVAHISDVFDFRDLSIEPYTYACHKWQTSGSLRTTRLAYNLFNDNKLIGDDTDEEGNFTVNSFFNAQNYNLYTTAIGIKLGNIKIEDGERSGVKRN